MTPSLQGRAREMAGALRPPPRRRAKLGAARPGPDAETPSPNPWRLALLFGLAYVAAAELGHLLTVGGAAMATLWPPAGLYVAMLLLHPARRWPTLAAAALAANLASDTLLHGRPVAASLGFCAANAAEAFAGAWLARRLAGGGGAEVSPAVFLSRLRGMAALLAGAAAAGPAVGALVGAASVHLAFAAPYGQTWALWWAGDALGALAVAPFVLAAFAHAASATVRPGAPEMAVRAGEAVASAALMATSLLFMPDALRVYFLPLPAMVWAALRGRSPGAAAALAGAALAGAALAALGAPHFALSPHGALTEVARMQAFLAMAGATCHLLAAAAAERAAALRRAEAAEERLRAAVEGAGMATFDTDWGSGRAVWSRGRFAMLGHPAPDGPEGEATVAMANERLHPDDRDAVLARLDEARRTGLPYAAPHRVVRADDSRVRCLEAHGRFLDADPGSGRAGTRNVGVVFDVTRRAEAEERERLLLREVEHRAKNALQVVRSLLRSTPFAGRDAFVAAVDARVGAMARAHTLLSGARWSGADLRDVAEAELGPLMCDGPPGAEAAPRVSLRGPAGVRLGARAAQGLSLLLHELATNAAKHGALSASGGSVVVAWERSPGGGVVLHWCENGGPPVAGPPSRSGFGSRLVAASAWGELGGGAEFRWPPNGLAVEVRIAADRLDPSGGAPSHVASAS